MMTDDRQDASGVASAENGASSTAGRTPADAAADPASVNQGRLAPYDYAGYVLGFLSPGEVRTLQTAAAQDRRVAAGIAEFEDALNVLAFAPSNAPINKGRSAGIRSRLLSRASIGRDATHAAGTQYAPPPRTTRGADRKPEGEPPRPPAAQVQTPSAVPKRSPRAVAAVPAPVAPLGTPAAQPAPVRPAAAVPASRPIVVPGPERTKWGSAIVLALACAAIAGGVQEWRLRQVQQTAQSEMPAALTETRAAQDTPAADSLIAMLTGAELRTIDLINYSSNGPLARVYWDPAQQSWLLYTFGLRPPKEGHEFQLWLERQDGVPAVSLGTFTPKDGAAPVIRTTYALQPAALRRIVVSEEPAGGAASPAGAIVIAGAPKP